VTKIESYGVFVKIHGITALLHISEIEQRTNRLQFLHVGNRITVKIIHIDQKQGRLSLSQKNL
jgi:ribosomal protein S1